MVATSHEPTVDASIHLHPCSTVCPNSDWWYPALNWANSIINLLRQLNLWYFLRYQPSESTLIFEWRMKKRHIEGLSICFFAFLFSIQISFADEGSRALWRNTRSIWKSTESLSESSASGESICNNKYSDIYNKHYIKLCMNWNKRCVIHFAGRLDWYSALYFNNENLMLDSWLK